ncbi:CDP-alcohol phosphatidyltransferase family protein [Luteococcus sp. H154]|uniref:phosphatidylinositol phosphate synthase n=1 Tax=unclassified Luteococcus TaxID=2639923 RepID=UPI00313AD183
MVERLRKGYAAAMTPAARLFMALRMTPDMVTWLGTLLVIVVALALVPQGHLWQGALAITVCVLTDGVDGQMARMMNHKSAYGAFLDSTLDRVADGAIFGAVALYYAGQGNSVLWSGMAIGALVMGQVTSYAKARGLALGFKVWGGLAARGDRLLVLLVGMLLAGLGLHWAMPIALCYLLFASTWTVLQRMGQVKSQARQAEADGVEMVDPQATVAAEHADQQSLHLRHQTRPKERGTA